MILHHDPLVAADDFGCGMTATARMAMLMRCLRQYYAAIAAMKFRWR
jgi:hypothetical protein